MSPPSAARPVILADDFPLCRRCQPGEALRLGLDACVISLRDDGAALHMPPPDAPFTAPMETSFLVSLRDARFSVGFQDLLSYRVEGSDLTFRLGFHGSMSVQVAHAHGFAGVLRRSLAAGPEASLFSLLSDGLRPLAIGAMRDVLGDGLPEYEEIRRRRAALQAALETAFFPGLYACGLCLRPRSFSIEGFSRPMLHTHVQ